MAALVHQVAVQYQDFLASEMAKVGYVSAGLQAQEVGPLRHSGMQGAQRKLFHQAVGPAIRRGCKNPQITLVPGVHLPKLDQNDAASPSK